MRLLSQDNISLSVEDGSSLLLSNSSLNIVAEQLTVSEQTSSTPLLSVSTEGVGVASTRMDVTGSQGLSINGPLETSQVRSPSNQDLQIQSLSGELRLTGGRGLTLRDGPGFDGVTVTSSSDLSITSESGQVWCQCTLYNVASCVCDVTCSGGAECWCWADPDARSA